MDLFLKPLVPFTAGHIGITSKTCFYLTIWPKVPFTENVNIGNYQQDRIS